MLSYSENCITENKNLNAASCLNLNLKYLLHIAEQQKMILCLETIDHRVCSEKTQFLVDNVCYEALPLVLLDNQTNMSELCGPVRPRTKSSVASLSN